ncbi:MAG: TolC family protein [Candidatus Binataceae bacterium]
MKRELRSTGAAAAIAVAILGLAANCSAATITLPEAIARALRYAPAVEAANAAGELSRAHADEDRAALFPTASAGAEYYQAPGYSQVITNRGLSAAMLSLDYTAWDWGRRAAQLRAAQYVSEAAQLGVTAARAQIVFDTASAYFDLARAGDTVRDLNGSLDRLARYVATVAALRKSGRATVSDVLKVRSSRDSVELALAAAAGDRERAASDLGALINMSGNDFDVAEPSGVPPKPSGDLARSPVQQAAQRAIASAKMQIKAARAERYPTVKLAFTAGFVGIDPPATIDRNFGGSYDTVVSMPLFDGGAISARIDQAAAREHAAIAQAREAGYLLSRRMAEARARYDQAVHQIAVLARAQPTADDSFALAWTRFLGGGNVTMLEVLDSCRQANSLRLQRIGQLFAAREAAAEVNLLNGKTQ